MSDEIKVGDRVQWTLRHNIPGREPSAMAGRVESLKTIASEECAVVVYNDCGDAMWLRVAALTRLVPANSPVAAHPQDDTAYEDAIYALRQSGALGGAESVLAAARVGR